MGVVNLATAARHARHLHVLLLSPLDGSGRQSPDAVLVGVIDLLVDRALIHSLYHDPGKSMLGTFRLAIVIQLVQIVEGPSCATSVCR